MKHTLLLLCASIAAALSSASPAHASDLALSAVDNAEAPRVTQTVNATKLSVVAGTELPFVKKATALASLPDATVMNHLQLILQPSAARQAAMTAFIAEQHDPTSQHFQRWMSPAQFGAAFGVLDSDITQVTEWLQSQGFSVNSVYPNKTQIDFSGTVGQLRQSFHVQEAVATAGGADHLVNVGNLYVPAALAPVITGVMGLNSFHARPTLTAPRTVSWNAAKKRFAPLGDQRPPRSMALPLADGTVRGLVPNDMMTMYGITQLRANGVTGKGVTIAVVEDSDMVAGDWSNFVSVFNLGRFGGTFAAKNPAAPSGTNNCLDPDTISGQTEDDPETLLDAEWSTAIAPGARILVASCSDYNASYQAQSSNFFGGVYLAANNLINASASRPDIISTSYGFGEYFVGTTSEAAIDLMWAQADAEGISVFVATGDSGSNPSFNGTTINSVNGNSAIDANALAASRDVTAVGGTDLADVLDGTTSKYFAPSPSVVGGSALSYVPEIPWNQSCGNGVAAKAAGYGSALAFCQAQFNYQGSNYITSEGASGAPSSVVAKPAWQRQVYNAAADQSRDLPDVALFADSYAGYTAVVTCTNSYPCAADFSTPMEISGGTSLATPMFAGIQALVDQGLAARGLALDQGNAAPTLYALAAKQYGTAGSPSSGIATCSADNGATGTANCVFHNVTRGSNSVNCDSDEEASPPIVTAHCFLYDTGAVELGLTTTDASPTHYGVDNKAFGARPGWSFASGLGSVNATNLLIAWRAFVNAPSASAASTSR